MTCMEPWQWELFQQVCKTLGVTTLFGVNIKFVISAANYSGKALLCKSGACNRMSEHSSQVLQHPQGLVLATDFQEKSFTQGSVHKIRIFIELEDTGGMGGMPHYIEFDGTNWFWCEWCGGEPADRFYVRHSGMPEKI